MLFDFLNRKKGKAESNNSGGIDLVDKKFLEAEIRRWLRSAERQECIVAEEYYAGKQEILKRMRTVIGEDGRLQEVSNLPNNRLVDNQYAKMVDQKANYLVGKPLTFDSENKAYADELKKLFNKSFQRTFKSVGQAAINAAVSWLMPYYDQEGNYRHQRFEAYEICAFWGDSERTKLQCAVRVYNVEDYEEERATIKQRAEVFTQSGVFRFWWKNNTLVEDSETPTEPYIRLDDTEEAGVFNWERIPLVAFKSNSKEIPLIRRAKALQDGLNLVMSDFHNNLQEDPRNTILILENYDGENLGEFRKNLATYGAVKVRSEGNGARGDVRTLEIEVNAANFTALHSLFKKAIIENARGYDGKDERMAGNPNQMNIQSMYSDIDLDANGMETEFQASFEELLWFADMHLKNAGNGDFVSEEVNVIFNRDILINETEAIENCVKSAGLLSDETVVAQHPWVEDAEKELERIKKQADSEALQYAEAFINSGTGSEPDVGADADGKE